MVSLDPRTRPSASECLQMSWPAAASAQSLPAADTCQVLEAMVPTDLMVSPVIFSGDIESAKRDAVAIAKKRRDHSRSTCQIQRHQYNSSGSAGKFACRLRGNGLLPALFISSILLNSCYFGEAFQVGSRSVGRPLYQPKAHVSTATSGKCKSPLASNHIFQSSTAIHARGPVGYDDEYFRQKRMSFRGRGRGMFSNLSIQKILVLLNIVFFLQQILSAASYAPVLSGILSRSSASGTVSLKGSDLARRVVLGDPALTIMGRPSIFGQPVIVATSVGAFTMDFAHQTALSSIQPHRLITSGFLHGSLLHLAFNMRYLWTLPKFVEEGLGWPLYLSTYLASVVAGNLAHSSVASSGPAALGLCLGASGGICGMQGLMFVLLNQMGNRAASMSIFKNMIWLIIFGSITPGISNAGHVGGFIGGALVGYIFGPRYGSSYRMNRKWSLAVDDASPEYRNMMGFGIEEKKPRLKLRYLWLVLALVAWYKPVVRTIPICLWLGLKSPGLLSGLQMSVPPAV